MNSRYSDRIFRNGASQPIGTTMDGAGGVKRGWSAHPWRARCLRLLVYVLPIVASLAVVRIITEAGGVPTGSLGIFLLWWLLISLCATGVVSVAYRLTRRLLPLGALLELSLVFPDEAPSRFKLAMRSRTVESLEEQLRSMPAASKASNAQEAAEILLCLVEALDAHDRITRGHAERVRAYASSLGKQLGLRADELDRLNWAALLHDIGKLQVSTEILNKPGRPTEEEWEQLRVHPLLGERLVEPLNEWLGEWSAAVGYHHERWDGDGYPRGTHAEEIPLAGRIVAIADVYDVITSARSYKEPAAATEARAEIVRCSGTQFDPRLVRAFVGISLGRMRLVLGPISWLTHAPLLARMPLTPSIATALGGLAVLTSATALGTMAPKGLAEAGAPAAALIVHSPRTSQGTNVAQPRHLAAPAPSDLPVAPDAETADLSPSAPMPTADAPETEPAPPMSPAPGPTKGTTPQPLPSSTPAGQSPTPPPPTTPPEPTTPSPVPPTPLPPPSQPPPAQPPAPANVAPSFTAGSNQSALEDAGLQSVSGWATAITPGPADETGQTVSFSVSSDNPGLFSTQPAVAADGTLTYTPALNANGTATVTVAAVDTGGTANGGADTSAPQTFTITIDPVNDAPSFTAGSNQSAVSLLGAQSAAGWATAITPGPADETGQSVSFSVSSDNPGLFSTQPAVAPDGTLTFTPNLLALGTTTVTIQAIDTGGTANGGVDTSAPQTFTITII
jgi:hypothetical protein